MTSPWFSSSCFLQPPLTVIAYFHFTSVTDSLSLWICIKSIYSTPLFIPPSASFSISYNFPLSLSCPLRVLWKIGQISLSMSCSFRITSCTTTQVYVFMFMHRRYGAVGRGGESGGVRNKGESSQCCFEGGKKNPYKMKIGKIQHK